MKFLVTGDLYSKKGLFWAVLLFIIFSIFFWFSGFLNFYFKYGFSYESLFEYYFTDIEFPERISLEQLSEDIHINTFIFSFFYIILSSLFSITSINPRIKVVSVILFGIATIGYCISDFTLFISQHIVVYFKFITFCLLQVISGFMLAALLLHLLKRKHPGKRLSIQKMIVYIGSFLIFIFLISCIFIYYIKYGFSVASVEEYFLGNSEKFKRAKTYSGIFKTFYPHIITMAIFSFTLVHFSIFNSNSKKLIVLAGVVIFLSFFIENISSLLILYAGEIFVYLKILTFLIATIISLSLSLKILLLKKMHQ